MGKTSVENSGSVEGDGTLAFMQRTLAFHIDSAIAATFGMKKKKTLKPCAVPTLFIRPSAAAQPNSQVDSTRSLKRTTTAQATCETERVSTTKRMRGAFEKRERSRVCYKDFLRISCVLMFVSA